MNDVTKNTENSKEEILAKSRKANEDEGEEYAGNKGRKLGYILFFIMNHLIALYATWIGDMALMFSQGAVMAVLAVGIGIEYYRFKKDKWLLPLIVLMSGFAVYAAWQVVYLSGGF